MNNKGQALIEALFGFGVMTFTICAFGFVIITGGTHLILDHELDRLVLCLAAEKTSACENQSRIRLKLSAPWLEIQNCSGSFNIKASGHGFARARIIASSRFKAPDFRDSKGIQWQAMKFKVERHFNEQEMKKGSQY